MKWQLCGSNGLKVTGYFHYMEELFHNEKNLRLQANKKFQNKDGKTVNEEIILKKKFS